MLQILNVILQYLYLNLRITIKNYQLFRNFSNAANYARDYTI